MEKKCLKTRIPLKFLLLFLAKGKFLLAQNPEKIQKTDLKY